MPAYELPRRNLQLRNRHVLATDGLGAASGAAPDSDDVDRGAGQTKRDVDVLQDYAQGFEEIRPGRRVCLSSTTALVDNSVLPLGKTYVESAAAALKSAGAARARGA
ncbi:hypothetical protein NUW54_g9695 [Trametes sanguinea]|uniref:Uncharacterized protein n=1 Tax=Trametes sanguinea TaxID=158606 RepID=A0ACC1P437_9APHY|nr:hypothetical protein NUW54_g9695 [Trametes sanguinea]